jgi:hypothetical protein
MIPLPDLRQTADHDCGPCAVRIALRALRKRPKFDLYAALGTSPIDGTDPRSIESYMRFLGLWVWSGTGSLDDLRHATASRPAICLVTRAQVGHYVVVSGLLEGRVHYQCPSEGPVRMGTRTWLRTWRDVDRLGAHYHQWMIVPGKPPKA